jgi:Asp-tRNA(Asn)/Glu-tRNA(Gln) amidotransferase B subunit
MEEESLVRTVVMKSAARTAERRQEKRLAAQLRRRGNPDMSDAEITEKEVKTLVNLCKSGKISADELKRLSQVRVCAV